jgi:hypothetical protein
VKISSSAAAGCLVHETTKVRVKVKFSLEQATKAQMGSRGIALLFL